MIEAELHDGTILEFPDGTDQDVINQTVKNVLSSRNKKPVEEMGAIDYGLGMPLEIGKGLVRGFGQGVLSTASGAAQLADAATDLLGAEDLIDSGNENFLINLADQGTKAIEKNLGLDEEYKDSYLVKLGEGLGSIGSIFASGGIGGIATKAGLKAFKAGEKALKTGERAGEFAGAALSKR